MTQYYITLHCIKLHDMTWHHIVLHCITLRCVVLHYITLHCVALHYITLRRIALHYIMSYHIIIAHQNRVLWKPGIIKLHQQPEIRQRSGFTCLVTYLRNIFKEKLGTTNYQFTEKRLNLMILIPWFCSSIFFCTACTWSSGGWWQTNEGEE